MINYSDRYQWGFPHGVRTYFDWLGDEFKDNTKEQKLLDIGYLNSIGHDVRADIHSTYKDHSSVSEHDVRKTLYILLAELWGGRISSIEKMYDNVSLDRVIDVLLNQITFYYHRPTSPFGKDHYLKDPVDISLAELRDENPWKEIVKNYCGQDFLFGHKGEKYACADDLAILEEFNATAKPEHEYKLNVPAFPWLGNPSTASVIILSLNPGYNERESMIAKLIQQYPERDAEGYSQYHRDMLNLDASALLPEAHGGELTYRDLANMHGGWYWWDRLLNAFVNNGPKLSIEQILPKISVLQYIGYSSVLFKPMKKGVILPSQLFTLKLIKQIILDNPETIFVVPRNIKEWKNFLGDIWTSNPGRFIEIHNNRGQWLNEKVLGDKFSRIVDALKK